MASKYALPAKCPSSSSLAAPRRSPSSSLPQDCFHRPLGARRPRPDFRDIALERTERAECAVWALYEERSCVVVVGPEDLRIFLAIHRLPLVFPWRHLAIARNGQRLALSLTRGTLRAICAPCWEPAPYVVRVSSQAGEAFWNALRDKGYFAPAGPSPGPVARAASADVPLADLPGDALNIVSLLLSVPDVHEFMRVCGALRKQLHTEDFWRTLYWAHVPASVRGQVEEFSEAKTGKCSYADRAALFFLRFCQNCMARRCRAGPCMCGAVPPFNSLVRFDLGSFEKLRLRLSLLKDHLAGYNFNLQAASVRFSSRHHGSSLRQLLRRGAITGRAHVLVCEGCDKTIFGAFLGFPLVRLAPSFGSPASFLFSLGTAESPEVRIFHNPDAESRPARALSESFAMGLGGECALSLNDGLTEAFCEPSRWSKGGSLSGRRTPLSSVTLVSDEQLLSESDKKVAHVSDWGTDASIERNVAHLLLDLAGCQEGLRHHFD